MIKQKLKYAISLLKSYNIGKFSQSKQYFAQKIQRNKPVNYNTEAMPYFDHALQYTLPDTYIYETGKALLSKEGFVYVNGRVLPGTDIANYQPKLMEHVVWSNNTFSLPLGKYLSVHTIWSDNYNHWLSEAFQKLYAIKQYLGTKINDYSLLLPDSHNKSYITESLKLAGITNVQFMPKDTYAIAENFICSTLAANVGNYRPEILSAIRSDFHSHLGVGNNVTSRNIYISRKKADKRFLLNEEIVIDLVKKYGFEVLHFEDLNFTEQVKTMAETKNMISLHGAGLTNMMFMPPNGNVLELRLKGDTQMNLFYNLCDAAGLNYYYQLCKGDADTKDVHDVNLTADLATLEQNIKLMLMS